MADFLSRLAAWMTRSLTNVASVRGFSKSIQRVMKKKEVVQSVSLGGVTFRMILYPEHHIDFLLHYIGQYEPEVAGVFPQLLKPGQTVLDLGANIGYYSIAAGLLVGPSGSVHAFEPVPATFAQLLENARISGLCNLHLRNIAVANRPGRATIYIGGEDPGSSSLARNEFSVSECTVQVVKLDDYVRENGLTRVDLIKMDIEGAEMLALLGMHDTLEKLGPSLMFEFNPPCLRRMGFEPERMLEFLEDYGYSFYSANEQLMPLRREEINDYANIYASVRGTGDFAGRR